MPSSSAAQGHAGNTEDPTVCKKDGKERGKQSSGRTRSLGRTSCREESNPSRNYDPCPKEDTRRPAPTALRGDRNGNHGFNSLATYQAKACGHPASPAGKGGNRKARNTSHTRQLEDLLLEEECGCLTLPQGLPWPRTRGGQPREQSLQHLCAPSQERP